MRKLIAVAALLGCALSHAQPLPDPMRLQPPSETDLKAAYCFGIAKQAGQTMQPQLVRLQGYLMPRSQFLDFNGLMTASRQAEIDVNADLQAIQNCVSACNTRECASNCKSADAMQAKLKSCSALDFLPY